MASQQPQQLLPPPILQPQHQPQPQQQPQQQPQWQQWGQQPPPPQQQLPPHQQWGGGGGGCAGVNSQHTATPGGESGSRAPGFDPTAVGDEIDDIEDDF
mmetsp:Transcript_39159/g.90713  ORF Transcript_39159/g.90713 Transcript_39159/m.90713 type:complete len:99 (+) Transcript_39159:119-415(+)